MGRNLTDAAIAELESHIVRPVFLVSIAYATETVYAWTGIGDLSWSGHTWKGVGSLGNVSSITEGSSVQANGITLTLTGIDPTLLPESMQDVSSCGVAQVYLGFVTESGELVSDPIPAYLGLTDQPEINLGTDTVTIAISIENRLSQLNRARGGRLTDQDQRCRYPNDKSLSFVKNLQDQHISWK